MDEGAALKALIVSSLSEETALKVRLNDGAPSNFVILFLAEDPS